MYNVIYNAKTRRKKCDFGQVLKYIPMMLFLKKYNHPRIPITEVVVFIHSSISKHNNILF